jgi:hypothetical protein
MASPPVWFACGSLLILILAKLLLSSTMLLYVKLKFIGTLK